MIFVFAIVPAKERPHRRAVRVMGIRSICQRKQLCSASAHRKQSLHTATRQRVGVPGVGPSYSGGDSFEGVLPVPETAQGVLPSVELLHLQQRQGLPATQSLAQTHLRESVIE